MSRFLVTGGAGFIGSHLVERLVRDGHHVRVLDDFSTGRRENLSEMSASVEVIEGTVTDPADCADAVTNEDYVLHQAALPSVPRSLEDPAATHHACATGTLNILDAARLAGVRRLVYAASSSAYGDTDVLPKHEDMPPLPRSPYAAAKLAGEHYCQAYYASFGFETIGLRYFNVFGPRQDPQSEYAAVVPKFIAAALNGMRPVIFGDGAQTRDFTYVENAVEANILACYAERSALGKVFNVGCGERISVNDLWQRIRDQTGAAVEARYLEERPGDVRDSLAGLGRIRRLLGYEPIVGIDEGLRRTIADFRGGNG